MMFSRSVLESIKVDGEIFDSAYFAYFEETDLCHRIWVSGKRILYAPKAMVMHKMGATSSKMENSFIQYHSFKNRIATYIKNLSLSKLLLILPFHILLCEGLAFASLCSGNVSLWKAIHMAIWWNMRMWNRTMIQRKYIQEHIRQLPDNTFYPAIMRHPGLRYYLSFFGGAHDYEE
jgi:GT2 family glycosyltransferase